MKIAIGTTNKAKVNAVKSAISKVWKQIEFAPVEVESGVRPQPLTDDEGIRGAVNRANRALKSVPSASYGIGLEGSIRENRHGMFLGGWVVIVNRKGTMGLGSSGFGLLPKFMQKRISNGEEVGPIVQELMRDSRNEIRHSSGAMGVLTDELVTRTEEFEYATRLALAVFISPKMYKKRP